MASSPLIIVPTTTSVAAVLVSVKARPGNDGACGQGRATADLDRPCARRPQHVWVGAKKRDSKSNKETGMKDFSSDHRWLSLNTATLRKQGDLLQIIDACARHNIRAIDPWRDQVAAVGLDRAVRAVRDAGLELSGYYRGGMFTADAPHRSQGRGDNCR